MKSDKTRVALVNYKITAVKKFFLPELGRKDVNGDEEEAYREF